MLQKIVALLKPDVSIEAKLTAISIAFAKLLVFQKQRIDKLETKVLIPLRDGIDGKDGKIGPKGLDGLPGVDGKDGKDGKEGKRGPKGEQGVSVVDAEIAADDHLVFKLSNDKIIDAGEIPTTTNVQQMISRSLTKYQITVSATAPDNPEIGELWYDLS